MRGPGAVVRTHGQFSLNVMSNSRGPAVPAGGRSAGPLGLGDQPFALCLFARGLTGAANGFAGFAGTLFRRLFISTPTLHLAEEAFALKLFLQSP